MMHTLTVSHPRLRLTVETRRDEREARIPRLIIRAPGETGVWHFRAAVSRVRAAVEELSASVVSGAPWDVRERQCWDRGSGVCVALELRTFGGSDREADLGLRLLERLADEFAARQVAA